MQRNYNFNRNTVSHTSQCEIPTTQSLKSLIYDVLPPQRIKQISREILGIKKYKSAKSGFFALAWRFVFLLVILTMFSSGVGPFSLWKKVVGAEYETKLKKIELYPTACQSEATSTDYKIGWWNEKAIIGAPQAGNFSDLIDFNEDNSVFYQGGKIGLVCSGFNNDNPEEKDVSTSTLPEEIVATTTELMATTTNVLDDQLLSSSTEEVIDNTTATTSEILENVLASSTEATTTPTDILNSPADIATGTSEEVQPENIIKSEQVDTNLPPANLTEPNALVVDSTDDRSVKIEEPAQQPVEILSEPPQQSESAVQMIIDQAVSLLQPIKNFFGQKFSAVQVALFGSKSYAIPVAHADNAKIEDLGIFNSAKIKLSLAMARKIEKADIQTSENGQDPEPNFVVWYSLADNPETASTSATSSEEEISPETNQSWQELGNFFDLPLSNFMNGGYYTFDASFIQSWEQAKKLKIKIEGRIVGEAPFVAYFDSVWMEVYYQSYEDKEAQDQKMTRWSKMLELLSDRTTFRVNEKGELKFLYKKNDSNWLNKTTDLFGFTNYWQDVNIKVLVEDLEGTTLDIPVTTMLEDNGEFTIKLPMAPRQFKPGKYKIKFLITDSSGDRSEDIVLEQGFSWGVLALNANKSLYTPGETAYLQMAVLDDYGDTLCDVNLSLEITAPDGGVAELNTENGLIQKSTSCGPNSTSPEPDYFVHYGLAGVGDYKIRLIAKTENGTKEIFDQIEVVDSLPLDIERTGPTRIYPKSNYEMKIIVHANEDYEGNIIEVVPASFKITNDELRITNENVNLKIENSKYEIQNDNDSQKLIWSDLKIKQGETIEISYEFDAPDVSPEFYQLGPLQTAVISEARQWQIASDAISTRARSVTFLAGTWSGNGAASAGTIDDSNTNQVLPVFNFQLGESGVVIKNAYVMLEAQIESYVNNTGTYSYQMAFDACETSGCTPNAWTGTSSVSVNDATVLAYDESESDQVRLLFDVTNEAQLANYTGDGATFGAQVGYRFNFSGGVVNSISYAKAVLIINYVYSASSTNITNTVVYPLESNASGDTGTRTNSQADDCILNGNCPLFNYNMSLSEFNSSAKKVSQWFKMYNNNYNNLANDITANVNIQGDDTPSVNFVHESALSDQGSLPSVFFNSVSGYSENSSQQLEYRASSPGAPTYYLIGGEVSETYIASSSASTKTRTVSFPIGVVNNGLTTSETNASVDVYFPENGLATGTVSVKKAWLRINSNNYNNVLASTTVATDVGSEARSNSSTYNYMPAATAVNTGINIIYVIASTSYAELEKANADIAKTITLYTKNSSATNQGGLSAELMITYTYTSESQGYLTSLNLFAGQSAVNGNARATTTPTAKSILPEIGQKNIYAAALLASYLRGDSNGTVLSANQTHDAEISTGTPTCTNAYYNRPEAFNNFFDYYSSVKSAMNTTNNQQYNACYSSTNTGDATAGTKMNGILLYTYGWENSTPTSTIVSAVPRRDASGDVNISIIADDYDHDDLKAKVEYVANATCDFTSPNKATLSLNDASTTATYGDPKIDNNLSYQIGSSTGWIVTSSGVNMVNFVWRSTLDQASANGTYCLRVTANDMVNDQVAVATTTFILDNVKPTIPGPLSYGSRAATSTTLSLGATTTETNFKEYKLFYKIYDGSRVTEADMVQSSSTNPNLGNKLFNGATTTTINSLNPGTNYSFMLWVYDTFGHVATSTQISTTTNSYPLGSFNGLPAQDNNGSGVINISTEVDDLDNDDLCRARIEYASSTCDFTTPLLPTLDTTQTNIQADFGTPKINNSNYYQVGNSSGWILTSPGSNTVNFDWLSKTELNGADGTYCLRLTVFDSMNRQATSATTTINIDNKNPTAPGNLTKINSSVNSLTLGFGATSSDTHFSKYRIFYKQGSAGVSEADTEQSDTNLTHANYNGAATTTITGLTPNTQYVINIWAYDVAGNKATTTEITAWTDLTIKNESLTFINPVSANQGVADNTTELNFQAVASEYNGFMDINNVVLHLADSNGSSSPYSDLAFTWTNAGNVFSETGTDNLSAARLATSSSSSCAGTSCTLNFKIIFNNKFTTANTNYNAELISTNNSSVNDHDMYPNFYKIRTVNVKQIHYRWRNDNGYE